jgi:cytidylate kinase
LSLEISSTLDPSTSHNAASVIAIDGPVASGKSSIGRKVADRLGGYRFVDTGMMYRAITWLALNHGLDLHDEEALAALAAGVEIRLDRGRDGAPVLYLNGENVTGVLREHPIDHNVPFVSEVPGVRHAMVPHQRALAAQGRLVMVGRDIGSEVLKDAPLKVFLTASPKVRAERRHREFAAKGDPRSQAQILEEVRERDRIDEGRQISPLLNPDKNRLPAGTYLLVTDHLDEDAVVELICHAANSV